MIKVTLSFDAEAFEAMNVFASQIDDINAEIVASVKDRVERQFMYELIHEPKRRTYPTDYPTGRLEWTSDAQRRYYWAVIAKFDSQGNHIPYKRTGKLKASWKVTTEVDEHGASIVVSNSARYSKFVVGSLASNRTSAQRFQQRFHRITGWPLAVETVDFWANAISEVYQQEFDVKLKEFAQSKNRRSASTT